MTMGIRWNVLWGVALLGVVASLGLAQETRISSAYYTKWKAGLAQLMKSPNDYVAQRALADMAEAGVGLPESERDAALRFLHMVVRQGNRKDPAAFLRLFDPALDQRRKELFTALERLPWTGGVRGLTLDLLQDMTAQAGNYSSESLVLPAFVETCREQQIPADTIEGVAKAFRADSKGLMDALCLGSRVLPSSPERWEKILEDRFGKETEASCLAQAFFSLNQASWNECEKSRDVFRKNLANWFFEKTTPEAWTKVDRPIFHSIVKASGKPPQEWELRLGEAICKEPMPALRDCLAALIEWHENPLETYRAIEPLLSTHQGLFCELHEPKGQSVMDQLNVVPSNRSSSRKILAAFLEVSREAQWDSRLGGILKNYYSDANSRGESAGCDALFSNVVAPILAARFDPGFEAARADIAIRKSLASELSSANCFLHVRHQREGIQGFIEHLDWEAGIARNSDSVPNYRFTADVLQALGQRSAGQGASRADAIAHVADLARWVNWMLRGGLERPTRLQLGVDEVDNALQGVCRSWTQLKKRYGLTREELGLGNLFAGVMKELSEAVTAAKTTGLTDDDAGRQRRDRVVRAVRLTLTISALIEDESQLPVVLDLMRDKLFALPAEGATPFRVRPSATLRAEVALFRALDEDLGECLRNLAEARDCTTGMKNVLRSFADRYHRQIQLGLVSTDAFLSTLQSEDPKLMPYRRYIDGGPSAHPCALDVEQVRSSLAMLTNTLDSCGFVNGEAALAELLGIYRERLGLSFWQAPWMCGSNVNMGLPLLFRLLRSEKTPPLLDNNQDSQSFFPVVEALLDALSGSQSRLLTRIVERDVNGATVRTEYYPARAFLKRADHLLRAQELLSYPVLGDAGPVPVKVQAEALVQSAVSDSNESAVPGITLPGEGPFRRRIEGTRRVRLCSVAQANTTTVADAVVAAECALMLPNFDANAADAGAMAQYDGLRAAAFEKLQSAIAAEPQSGALADGLIAMLRLEVCQRGRGVPLPAATLVAELSGKLPSAGRWRVMVETWSLKHHAKTVIKPRHCPQHKVASVDCRTCRDAVAAVVSDRADELADIRRFCQKQAGVPAPAAPKNRWEAAAQLARCNSRLQNTSGEIAAIGPDTVKAGWYLMNQLQQVKEIIPQEWGSGWTAKLSTNEPMTEALIRVCSFSTATYGELLPICGNIGMDALLGNGNQPANGDALALFSLLTADIKGFLLEVAPLESLLESMGKDPDTAIGTLPTRDLVAVHSAMQPSIVAEIWRRGANPVKEGGSLMKFVVEGKRYSESYFDADIVHEVGGSFSLSPRRLFDEAFRSVDLMVASAGENGGDDFVYNAWFGDMRRALAEQGLGGNDYFNMDRFLCAAADMTDDRRYEAPEMASVRGFAEAFQHDLKSWMDAGGTASMANLLKCAHHPGVVTALAERIGDRLGLGPLANNPGALEPLDNVRRAAYAGFCRKALFDTGGGRAVFPTASRKDWCSRFQSGIGTTNRMSEARARFLELFTPYAGAIAGKVGAPHFEGLPGLYNRSLSTLADPAAKTFAGDYSYAYMHLASDLYWSGARDGMTESRESTNGVAVCYPWRMDKVGRPYIDVPLPQKGMGADRLHTDSIRSNLEWRAAAAERFHAVPFLCRFFGGDPTQASRPESGKEVSK